MLICQYYACINNYKPVYYKVNPTDEYYIVLSCNMDNVMPKLHILKHDKSNVLMLPIAVADPRLNNILPLYAESLDVNWLQRDSSNVNIVSLPEFDINVKHITYTAASISAQTSATMALLVGCFHSEQEMNNWINMAMDSRDIAIGQAAFEDNTMRIKTYKLKKRVHNSLTNKAFFVNNTAENAYRFYALFVNNI